MTGDFPSEMINLEFYTSKNTFKEEGKILSRHIEAERIYHQRAYITRNVKGVLLVEGK